MILIDPKIWYDKYEEGFEVVSSMEKGDPVDVGLGFYLSLMRTDVLVYNNHFGWELKSLKLDLLIDKKRMFNPSVRFAYKNRSPGFERYVESQIHIHPSWIENDWVLLNIYDHNLNPTFFAIQESYLMVLHTSYLTFNVRRGVFENQIFYMSDSDHLNDGHWVFDIDIWLKTK